VDSGDEIDAERVLSGGGDSTIVRLMGHGVGVDL